MKKRARKIWALLLGAAMILSVFAGCGTKVDESVDSERKEQKEENENSDVAGDSKEEDSKADISEHVDLTLYLVGDEAADTPEIYAKVSDILEEKLNCSLTVKWISWAESEKYSMLFSGGEDFDMIFTASQWMNYESTVALDGFYPMTEEFIQTYAPDVWETLPEMAWDQAKMGGTAYMVPNYLNEFGQEVLAVRGDLMEKYDFETISNWDEYVAFQKACAADGIYGSRGNLWWTYFQSEGMYVTGGTPIGGELILYNTQDPTDTNFYYALEWDGFTDYCHQMKELVDAGAWSRDQMNVVDERQDGLLNGTTALLVWNAKACYTHAKTANAEHPEWKMTLVDPIADQPKRVNSYTNAGIGINKNSKNPERAMMVINEMFSNQEIQDLTMLGIEGKNWEDVGDNQYKLLDQSGYAYDSNCNWGWRNQNLFRSEYVENRSKLDDVFVEITDSFNANVKDAHVYDGFSFDPTNVSTQVAAVTAANDLYGSPLTYGLVDDVDKTLEDYRKALEDAGIQDILDELNAQAEAFRAEKGME